MILHINVQRFDPVPLEWSQRPIEEQLLYVDVQWFRVGLVLEVRRLCVSLNSMLESYKGQSWEVKVVPVTFGVCAGRHAADALHWHPCLQRPGGPTAPPLPR